MRLARNAVTVAIHMLAITGIAAIQRRLAGGAHFVAAAVVDRLLNCVARLYLLLRDGREIVDT